MKNNKNIRSLNFFGVFNSVSLFWHKIYQILTMHRKQSVESKSVEIFGLSLMVFELEVFSFSFFNSVHLQCNDLSWKSSGF
jgi:hypothetical protein